MRFCCEQLPGGTNHYTIFFLLDINKGGRYDPVSGELDSMEDLAFHLAMFIFLFSTTILMLNVLIGKTNYVERFFCGTTFFLMLILLNTFSLPSSRLTCIKNCSADQCGIRKGR